MLYFENLSGVKEDEYFRDGITEDIITELSKIKGLRVFSRPTVLAYRDKSVTAGEIGRQLSAAYVLAGSLRRAGTRLRINAQLIDTRTDFPLWSERYDREMQDIFEVQDEIARKIATALRITLTGAIRTSRSCTASRSSNGCIPPRRLPVRRRTDSEDSRHHGRNPAPLRSRGTARRMSVRAAM